MVATFNRSSVWSFLFDQCGNAVNFHHKEILPSVQRLSKTKRDFKVHRSISTYPAVIVCCFVAFFTMAGKSAAKESTAASSVVQERLGQYITDRRNSKKKKNTYEYLYSAPGVEPEWLPSSDFMDSVRRSYNLTFNKKHGVSLSVVDKAAPDDGISATVSRRPTKRTQDGSASVSEGEPGLKLVQLERPTHVAKQGAIAYHDISFRDPVPALNLPPPLLFSLTGQWAKPTTVAVPTASDNASPSSSAGGRRDRPVPDTSTVQSRKVVVRSASNKASPSSSAGERQYRPVPDTSPAPYACRHCRHVGHFKKKCDFPKPYPSGLQWPPPLNLEPPKKEFTLEELSEWIHNACSEHPKFSTKRGFMRDVKAAAKKNFN